MRPSFRLVPDFIIPHLNKSTYKNDLQWEDKKKGNFKISRIHQSSDKWNEQCIDVYKAWSVRKKLWHADDPKKITRAKHRLITALRRNPDIEVLPKESSFYRFRIIHLGISGNGLYEDAAQRLKVYSVGKNNKNEFVNFFKSRNESENCDMKNTPEPNKGQKEYPGLMEANINSTYWTFSSPELYDVQKMFQLPDDIFDEEFYSGESKSSVFSDKCCCEKLLDNYLCNKKCIWHGMPL